jgi:hypothetical protein
MIIYKVSGKNALRSLLSPDVERRELTSLGESISPISPHMV